MSQKLSVCRLSAIVQVHLKNRKFPKDAFFFSRTFRSTLKQPFFNRHFSFSTERWISLRPALTRIVSGGQNHWLSSTITTQKSCRSWSNSRIPHNLNSNLVEYLTYTSSYSLLSPTTSRSHNPSVFHILQGLQGE